MQRRTTVRRGQGVTADGMDAASRGTWPVTATPRCLPRATPHDPDMTCLRTLLATSILLLAMPGVAGRDAAAGNGAAPRRISIHPQTDGAPLTMKVGEPLQLSARLELEGGRSVALDEHVTWSTSDPTVLRLAGAGSGAAGRRATPLRTGVVAVTIVYPSVAGGEVPYPTQRALGDALTVVVREP